MKNQKLLLDSWDERELTLALIRLSKPLPDHEFFFEINAVQTSKFKRIEDFQIEGQYFDYFHARFEAYHYETKTCLQFISNASRSSIQKKEVQELFSDEQSVNYLLPIHKDVDYILKTSDAYPQFSLILLPENLVFPLQEIQVGSQEELYQLIQYYE